MKEYINKTEMIKIWLSVGLAIFGCILLLLGIFIAPVGVIHNSVLISVGEVFTFSGSILGINAVYQGRLNQLKEELKKDKP